MAKNESTKEQDSVKEQANEQDKARNAEASGVLGPNNGSDVTATTPVNAEANFPNALSEATERGYMGGSDPEERFTEEERARRIRAGLVPGASVPGSGA